MLTRTKRVSMALVCICANGVVHSYANVIVHSQDVFVYMYLLIQVSHVYCTFEPFETAQSLVHLSVPRH